ncbi:MAG: aspartate aminotransferase family protein, partial [Gammaproteobacteria bacterium]
GVWLYDDRGRRYLDCYNNVPHVGHCNPDVVEAMRHQAATLNVHTRYLHEGIVSYGERLTATLDDSLSMALFTCTGSEANDQALRIARQHTGREGIVCTNLTYHGNTSAVDEISPLFYGGTSPSPRVRAIPYPDSYRAPDGLGGTALADHYLAELDRAIASLEESGAGFAGLIVCAIFANEGLPDVPEGFLPRAVERVRAAGGLFIADEVQAGFGRCGRMWGHEVFGVVPDIVTMGKPMGNGYPLAATVARAELVEGFRREVMYFNTFAGNPVAAAVGHAVLDVMARDDLVSHAGAMGEYLRSRLADLAGRCPVIGDVRGHGLWVGVELVGDRAAKTPATDLTRTVVNRMKERGVLMNRIGEFDNVLKIRPPLPFDREHADLLLETLESVLDEH